MSLNLNKLTVSLFITFLPFIKLNGLQMAFFFHVKRNGFSGYGIRLDQLS